ncbi:FAD-dependent oxidoreductase [Streptomyces sp. NBC_00160]|uniref:flavin monoamine oxidase family protein n=1 Tax=Streptomyces sp. NBC_00160 TaxID=2903628 RepID=UPI00225AE7BA|nr:NAD(P)/FAD-dependent oxidoreductase [Streptomyces sp. NBC_00160]MCX5304624.1 FAD-dependent oxidoreductase [Streptomyces sp. NBC_00160]
MRTDVLVVGAGISGLTCASRLTEAGLRVIVQESRERVGGRIRTFRPADGGPALELGAQVVHGVRNPVHTLMGSDRMETVPRDVAARVVEDGALAEMAVLARGRRGPWALEAELNAAEGDADVSVGDWLRSRGADGAEGRAVREWYRQNWAVEPDALSARAVARAHRGDDVGGGEFAVSGGFDRLPAQLARSLEVRLGCPVDELDWSKGRVRARTAQGELHAGAAVVAVPPQVVVNGRLRIGGLPAAKWQAAKDLPAGDGYCAVVTLSAPAPESAVVFDVDGLGGFARSRAGRQEVLIVAKAGAAAAVRSAVRGGGGPAALLARSMPWTRSARVVAAEEADWGNDPWSGGAFTAPGTGARDASDLWAEPVEDTLFFAGEATVCGRRLPWVQGAIASGERAAAQILSGVAR